MRLRKWSLWIGLLATCIGVLVGIKALAWSWPWNGPYESVTHANMIYDRFEFQWTTTLNDIKVDIAELRELHHEEMRMHHKDYQPPEGSRE